MIINIQYGSVIDVIAKVIIHVPLLKGFNIINVTLPRLK